MKTRTFKSGLEIVTGQGNNGEPMYYVVNPNGYIGRTQIGKSFMYREALAIRREAEKDL